MLMKTLKSLSTYLALGLILLLYTILAIGHSNLAPLTTGPDELAHYEYVNFIATHGRLPFTIAEREQASYKSDQPPLFHLLAAYPASWVDITQPPILKRVQDNPRRQLIERTRHAWGIYNTEDETWPYRSEILRWQTGRWLAIFFGGLTLIATFFTARLIFHSPEFALVTTTIVAFIPRFLLTGSMLNYETMVVFITTLFLWVMIRLALCKSLDTRCNLYCLLIGFLAGLAITTKLSALILPIEIVLALWLIGQHHGWPRKYIISRIIWAGISCLIAVSWWFGFVIYQFNTIAKDGWWVGLLRPLIAADSSDATTNWLLNQLTSGQAGETAALTDMQAGSPIEWLTIFFRTFWMVGIEQQLPLWPIGLMIILLICLIALASLILLYRDNETATKPTGFIKANCSNEIKLILNLLVLHCLLPFVLPIIRYLATFSTADTAQGRHILFMAAPAIAILLVWGQVNFIHQSFQKILRLSQTAHYVWSLPAFLLIWSLTQLWTMSWAYHPLLPVRTTVMPIANPLDEPLTDHLTLQGYETEFTENGHFLKVNLLWQATAVNPQDYLTHLTLHDKQDKIVSQWLGYPAEGRYPNRAWDVDDLVRDTVWLPIAGLSTGDYYLRLNLQPRQINSTDPILNETLLLTPLSITSETATPIIELWYNGKPAQPNIPLQYRQTIMVTLPPNLIENRTLTLIGPKTDTPYQPFVDFGNIALFIVGPEWPTGVYRLQITTRINTYGHPDTITIIDRWQRQFTEPTLQHQVDANFANQVKLLGYDLPTNRAEAGHGIPLTLHWQGLDWLADDLTIFAKPILQTDQTAYGGRDRLPREGYRTIYWEPDEIVSDPFAVSVDSTAPNGIYYLHVGLYQATDNQQKTPRYLPLVQNEQFLEQTSIRIGPIKVGQTPPDMTLNQATPQYPLNQPFGEPNLTLLGYDWQPHCQTEAVACLATVTLYWQTELPMSVDYTTFVHLRNQANETIAQQDQPPLHGAYPTSLWDTGEIIADEITLPLPPHLPLTPYQLVVGLYEFHSQQRLAIPGSIDNSLTLSNTLILHK